jgi:hypothetical protein
VEKILKVGERRSIVKTFFVIQGVEITSIAIANLALFILLSNFHKMKIPMVTVLEFETQKRLKKRN